MMCKSAVNSGKHTVGTGLLPVRDMRAAFLCQRCYYGDEHRQRLVDAGHLIHSHLAHLHSLTPALRASQVHKIELAAQHATSQTLLNHHLQCKRTSACCKVSFRLKEKEREGEKRGKITF